MTTLPSVAPPVTSRTGRWRALQALTLAGFAAVLGACALYPERTLPFLWSGVMPLLPALFLVHPGLWRNVCPLASLGMGAAGRGALPRTPSVVVPVVALLLLIPLRRLGLEESAAASGGLLAAAACAALVGRVRPRKAGFCNRWCPILPVERLYGQHPLLAVGNPRCPTCTGCTPRGCLDLSPRAAAAQQLGPGRRGHGWLSSGLGAFAAAFPGVVAGFFLLPEDPGVWEAYGVTAAWGLTSWMAAATVVLLTGAGWRKALPTLAALAAAVFFWFALPGVAAAWRVPGAALLLRAGGLALAAYWGFRAVLPPSGPGRLDRANRPGQLAGTRG